MAERVATAPSRGEGPVVLHPRVVVVSSDPAVGDDESLTTGKGLRTTKHPR